MTLPTGTAAPAARQSIGSTGRWLVRTHASVYELNLDTGTVVRTAGQGSAPDTTPVATLRRDGDPVPLHAVGKCEVGWPMVLIVDVRADGVLTQRVSTTVTSIEPLA